MLRLGSSLRSLMISARDMPIRWDAMAVRRTGRSSDASIAGEVLRVEVLFWTECWKNFAARFENLREWLQVLANTNINTPPTSVAFSQLQLL